MASSYSRVTVESLLNDGSSSSSDMVGSSPTTSFPPIVSDYLRPVAPLDHLTILTKSKSSPTGSDRLLEFNRNLQCPPALEVKRIPPTLSDTYRLSPYYTPAGSLHSSPPNCLPHAARPAGTHVPNFGTPTDGCRTTAVSASSLKSDSDSQDGGEESNAAGGGPQARSFHVFTRDTYDLMIWSLLQGRGPDAYTISHACGSSNKMTTKRWNRLQGNLRINVISPPGQADGLVYGKVVHPPTASVHKDLWVNAVVTNLLRGPMTRSLELRLVWRTCKRNLPIVPEEHWIDVFRAVHVRNDPDGREFHLRQAECIRMITSHYQTRRSRSGITNTKIRDFFAQCDCQENTGSSTSSTLSQPPTALSFGKRDRPSVTPPHGGYHLNMTYPSAEESRGSSDLYAQQGHASRSLSHVAAPPSSSPLGDPGRRYSVGSYSQGENMHYQQHRFSPAALAPDSFSSIAPYPGNQSLIYSQHHKRT